jgi:hypothetical protein
MFAVEQEEFWSNIEDRMFPSRKTKKIKFSYDRSNTLAYMDFLDLKKEKMDYSGPSFPLVIIISGEGSYTSPFYFNDHDPLVKSLYLLNPESKYYLS